MSAKTIGILGGMGPKTGVDLANKIIQNTFANTDQDYIPMLLISYPHLIQDRTAFLQGKHHHNPADIIFELITKLESWGADIIGMPCNTSHSPRIMNAIYRQLGEKNSTVILINMVESAAEFIVTHFPTVKKIGLLATLGTYQNAIYQAIFWQFGLEIIIPEFTMQHAIHEAIYDAQYGIKSTVSLNLDEARSVLEQACHHLMNLGGQVIILGCSEIPLALTEKSYSSIPLIDPTNILARKLIQLADYQKLKPYL